MNAWIDCMVVCVADAAHALMAWATFQNDDML